MAKGYWVAFYRKVAEPELMKQYVDAAMPAFKAGGANFLARNTPAMVSEMGIAQRVVIIEFPSVEAATGTYNSPEYQRAAAVLKGKVERDIRIVEGT